MAVRSPSAPDEPLEQERLRPQWRRKEQCERAGAARKWRSEVASQFLSFAGRCSCQYPAILILPPCGEFRACYAEPANRSAAVLMGPDRLGG
jgi:hypothetical protein